MGFDQDFRRGESVEGGERGVSGILFVMGLKFPARRSAAWRLSLVMASDGDAEDAAMGSQAQLQQREFLPW